MSPLNIARKHAVTAHNKLNQKYGTMPYVYHLDQAVTLSSRWKLWSKFKGLVNHDFIATVLYLHDIKEDCGVTHEELVNTYGEDIANIVDNVTKRRGENHIDYMNRVKLDIRSVVVKVCDSLTNLQHSVFEINATRTARYSNNIKDLVTYAEWYLETHIEEEVSGDTEQS